MIREPAFWCVYLPGAIAFGYLAYKTVQAIVTAPILDDSLTWEQQLDIRAVYAEHHARPVESDLGIDLIVGVYDHLADEAARRRGELA
jgi:hypothetical protein